MPRTELAACPQLTLRDIIADLQGAETETDHGPPRMSLEDGALNEIYVAHERVQELQEQLGQYRTILLAAVLDETQDDGPVAKK